MMRRTLLLGGLAVAAGAGWALTQGIFATGDVAMTYEDFRTRAMADLAHDADDLISFTPATTPFFQEIRSTAPAYLPLMMRLVDDPTVPVAVKFGASAAMLDLPVVDLTAYLAHLLDAAPQQPGLIDDGRGGGDEPLSQLLVSGAGAGGRLGAGRLCQPPARGRRVAASVGSARPSGLGAGRRHTAARSVRKPVKSDVRACSIR